MMIYPVGGVSFKLSGGHGYVKLKCQSQLSSESPAPVTFRITTGSGTKAAPSRGPVSHDFSQGAVSGLPQDIETWDFNAAVDEDSATFVVCLEVVPST